MGGKCRGLFELFIIIGHTAYPTAVGGKMFRFLSSLFQCWMGKTRCTYH